jgi:nicotinamide-nucleotide amidase
VPDERPARPDDRALRLVAALTEQHRTLAVAESLTGGLVSSTLVGVPGASAVLRGAVVAYATELKAEMLGVDPVLLDGRGAVDPDVARQMAVGVRDRLAADVGLATTGVAGPTSQDGHPPGTVHVAVAWADDVVVRSLVLEGDRSQIRSGAVDAVLGLALAVLVGPPDGQPDDAPGDRSG